MENDTQIECVICEHCLDQLESAGQLAASARPGSRVTLPVNCEQCGMALLIGMTYRVIIEP